MDELIETLEYNLACATTRVEHMRCERALNLAVNLSQASMTPVPLDAA